MRRRERTYSLAPSPSQENSKLLTEADIPHQIFYQAASQLAAPHEAVGVATHFSDCFVEIPDFDQHRTYEENWSNRLLEGREVGVKRRTAEPQPTAGDGFSIYLGYDSGSREPVQQELTAHADLPYEPGSWPSWSSSVHLPLPLLPVAGYSAGPDSRFSGSQPSPRAIVDATSGPIRTPIFDRSYPPTIDYVIRTLAKSENKWFCLQPPVSGSTAEPLQVAGDVDAYIKARNPVNSSIGIRTTSAPEPDIESIDSRITRPSSTRIPFEQAEAEAALADVTSPVELQTVDSDETSSPSSSSEFSSEDWSDTDEKESAPMLQFAHTAAEVLLFVYLQFTRQTTGESGKSNAQSSTSGATSSKRDTAPKSHRRGTKRRHGDDGRRRDGDEGEDEDELQPISKNNGEGDPSDRPLACPFHKYDPRAFGPGAPDSNYHICSSCSFANVGYLKQHLKYHHYAPYHYCYRCFIILGSEGAKATHMRACEKNEPLKYQEKISRDLIEELGLNRRNPKGINREQYWHRLYNAFFPNAANADSVSPYYEGPAAQYLHQFIAFSRAGIPDLITAVQERLGYSLEPRLNDANQLAEAILQVATQRFLDENVSDSYPHVGQSTAAAIRANGIGDSLPATAELSHPGQTRSSETSSTSVVCHNSQSSVQSSGSTSLTSYLRDQFLVSDSTGQPHVTSDSPTVDPNLINQNDGPGFDTGALDRQPALGYGEGTDHRQTTTFSVPVERGFTAAFGNFSPSDTYYNNWHQQMDAMPGLDFLSSHIPDTDPEIAPFDATFSFRR